MRETKAFVYKWTELSTGKWYIGSRTKKGCNQDDGYICSSKIVKPLILENKFNWFREILFEGEPKEVREYETKLLVSLNAAYDINSYNQHNSDGKWHTIGKEPWNKGKHGVQSPVWNKGLPAEMQPFYGKVFSVEHRKNLSESSIEYWKEHEGREPWNKGLILGSQSVEVIKKRTSWQKGCKRSELVGRKISETKNMKRKERELSGIKLFSWEEKYSQEYIEKRKSKLAEKFKVNNPNSKNKGKSWDEIMGPERAEERRNKLKNPKRPRKKRNDIGLTRNKNIT